jgi:hypothetical protein
VLTSIDKENNRGSHPIGHGAHRSDFRASVPGLAVHLDDLDAPFGALRNSDLHVEEPRRAITSFKSTRRPSIWLDYYFK